jgi:hypothetical protein
MLRMVTSIETPLPDSRASCVPCANRAVFQGEVRYVRVARSFRLRDMAQHLRCKTQTAITAE